MPSGHLTFSRFPHLAQLKSVRNLVTTLTVVALILWLISLAQILRTGLPADEMGIIHGLPTAYWVALGALTVASTQASRLRHFRIVAFQVGLFIIIFWLTPILVGHTLTGTRYSFGYHTLTQSILDHGRLDPKAQWYHNWPAFNLIDATLLEVIGPRYGEALIVWAVVPMQLLLALMLWALFRRRLPDEHWAVAAWFYLLFNWTGQTYFSPQGLANIFLIVLLFFLTWDEISPGQTDQRRLFLEVLVLAGLAITHMLSAFVVVFLLVGVELARRRRQLPVLGVIATIFTAAWLVYLATSYFNSQIPLFVERALRFDQLWFWNVTRAQNLSTGVHTMVISVRFWYTIAAGLIAFLGYVFSIRRRLLDPADGVFLAAGVAILAVGPIQIYQNELFSRLFLYLSPVLAYFAAKLARDRFAHFALTLLLLVALPFGIISLHGNQLADRVSLGQRTYWHFLEQNTESGHVGMGGIPMMWTFGHTGSYVDGFDWIAGYGSRWPNRLAARGWVEWGKANYLAFSAYEVAGFEMWTDFPDGVARLTNLADQIPSYQLIYSSGEVSCYYDQGRQPE